ncbi:hypothetical protein VTN02DRAFT_198 [Thermoascus thermophilus]
MVSKPQTCGIRRQCPSNRKTTSGLETNLLRRPADILVPHPALDPDALSLAQLDAITLLGLLDQEPLRLGAVGQDLAPQEPADGAVIDAVAPDPRLHVDVGADAAVLVPGAAHEAALADAVAEDVVRVLALDPGQDALLGGAADAARGGLLDVDVHDGPVVGGGGVGLDELGDGEGDGRVADGFAGEPADALLGGVSSSQDDRSRKKTTIQNREQDHTYQLQDRVCRRREGFVLS